MQIFQYVFSAETTPNFPEIPAPTSNQLVLLFGSTTLMAVKNNFAAIRTAFPQAFIVGCTTAGEIADIHVHDDTLVVTVINFEKTSLHLASVNIAEATQSFAAGKQLAQQLPVAELAHVLVLSDGLCVNGTELVRGLKAHLPAQVEITGGLSADGANFRNTLVCANEPPAPGKIVVLGLYGTHIKIGYGSLGGWDPFGPERLITRSTGNVLFDLDEKPALELYKRYLGEHADKLPSAGLLFPLTLRYGEVNKSSTNAVVRTILAVNEADQSMTFAGDVPEGAYVRLMKANFDRLIDGATHAAETSLQKIHSGSAEFALLITCVGRKLVLKQRIEEEVEAVREVLGENTSLAGFYSYGEISPHAVGTTCELHNQTMTITTFSET